MNVKSKYRLHALALMAMAAGVLWGCESEQPTAAQPPTPEVEVATLEVSEVTLSTELPGRTTPLRQAEIRPQVNGIITQRLFREGADIEAGEQLYQIDDASYRAAYSTARAQVAQAEANLKAARARETRYRDLVEADAISQQDYDDALAGFHQAEAALQSAQAAVETAKINLQYTRVLAPISGRIGKSSITEGALVTSGQAQPLAVIQQLDPIYVDVSRSVNQVLNLRRQLLKGELLGDDKPRVRLLLDDGSSYAHEGTLEFSEVDVNESTGTVTLRAVFPNPEQLLLPGMFVRAEVAEGRRPDSLLIPQKAVSHNRRGQATTLMINGDNKVEQRVIETDRAVGNSWIVLGGVEPGDKVIVAGLQKVQPGAVVTTVPAKDQNQPQTAQTQVEVN